MNRYKFMGFLILFSLAVLGFVTALICHILGWLHMAPPGGNWVFVLHIGCIALGFPLVIFANKTKPPAAKSNLDHLMAEVPKWARTIAGVVFGYGILNFIYASSQYSKHNTPSYVVIRGFSGHWMIFFGIEAIGFYALWQLGKKPKEKADQPMLRNDKNDGR